ncbi:MAG: hypothetical protein J3R72DRAFT_451819 [Linnemannia gamsii]|nr:MAG: hypothetical protein J3R72DRAFT_451819 [Linnemannia gamsii]
MKVFASSISSRFAVVVSVVVAAVALTAEPAEANMGCPFADIHCYYHCVSIGHDDGVCTGFFNINCECID